MDSLPDPTGILLRGGFFFYLNCLGHIKSGVNYNYDWRNIEALASLRARSAVAVR